MAKRYIADSIRSDEKLNQLSHWEFRVWVHLITYVDSDGRCLCDSGILARELFPANPNISRPSLVAAIQRLGELGLIELSKGDDGKTYLAFPTWYKYQRRRGGDQKKPCAAQCGAEKTGAAQCGAEKEEEKKQKKKQKVNIHTTAPACEEETFAPVESFPLNTGEEFRISERQYEEFCRLYPGVNVSQEFARIRAWCLSNPSKRKTKSGAMRFVNNWLSRVQNSPAPAAMPGNRKVHVPDYIYQQERGEYDKTTVSAEELERIRRHMFDEDIGEKKASKAEPCFDDLPL